ncbi:MAG TPA: DUF1800 domain-containing protein [Pyrinomonadaceae bacterium]|nr:DUF1800 domain-containing protein [Pyrinomonadaceae bacterium]
MKKIFRTAIFSILLLSCGFSVFAQDDANPESPIPVLLSDADKTRVLAVSSNRWNGELPLSGQAVFKPGAKSVITIFATNFDFANDEAANSVRVYLKQNSGKVYQLPVEDLIRIDKKNFALKVRLFEQPNVRTQPVADGDSLIYLTWRGLSSNVLKIGLGKTGGDIKIPNDFSYQPDISNNFVDYRWSGDRIRFLEQAAFGPNAELDNRIRRVGLKIWLNEQFQATYPSIPYPEIPLMPTVPPSSCDAVIFPSCFRERYTQLPLQQWFFKEAIYGKSQLRHRISWALSQIFVTSGLTIQQSSHLITYNKVLSENAFGNFKDLLKQVTLNPAMGNYLDMVRSTKNNPNENYPREILQLFSIGLFKLNQDGTVQTDGQGNPIPTYSQEEINNLSKVFTGWNLCETTAVCPNRSLNAPNYKDPMLVNPTNHDLTEKHLLNYPNAPFTTIPACQICSTNAEITGYANDSLDKAIENIFNHPNVGPFIGKLLIQHLVTSDPSPAYVSRVAAAFNNNGANVRGDMKAVIRAVLLDPEARGNIKTAPRYGKLREPVQLITNLTRIFPAKSFNGEDLSDGSLGNYTKKLGQNPFYSDTVFNYFPPTYIVPGTTVLAPEFGLLNTGTAINRTNLLYTLIFEGLTPTATDSLKGTSLDFSEVIPYAENDASGNQLLDVLNYKMMHNAMTTEQRNSILTAVTAVPASNSLMRVRTAVYLIAVSPQYQVQR